MTALAFVTGLSLGWLLGRLRLRWPARLDADDPVHGQHASMCQMLSTEPTRAPETWRIVEVPEAEIEKQEARPS